MQRLVTSAVLVVAAVTLAGCSGNPTPSGPTPSGTAGSNPPATSAFVTPTNPATPPNRALESQLNIEWTDRWLSCMTDNGFPPTFGDDGGFSFPGQQEAVSAAVEACSKQAGPDVTYAPMTPDEAGHMYDLELAAKACLESLGVTVSEPPSKDQYIQDALSQSADGQDGSSAPHVWQAYGDIRDPRPYQDTCPVPSLWTQWAPHAP